MIGGRHKSLAVNGDFSAAIRIMVGDKTLEELESEAAEAERLASEAKLKAKQLRDKINIAKRMSGSSN